MNLSEEKWTIQQPQVTPSSHHQHPSMSSNGMSPENFIQPFSPYEGQTTQGQIHSQPIFVSMPSAPTITPRQNGTPVNGGGAVRKRRADTMGFPQDAGPFFSQTTQHYNLYSVDRTISYKLRINSKVDRGFFLADNDWTCYRRNYFQISSAFSISTSTHTINESEIPCLLEVDGQFHGVTGFLLGITARVSNSDKKIELVQHTPKRDKGPQMVPVPKPIRAGGNLNLSSVGSNSNIVTFERIQFKTATANNGKRRAAQQYYVVMVDLYAQIENGEQIRVASSTSAPLVVRGRSPGHYADNHERYNPIPMNPAFPNDRHHMGFSPHPQGPNGAAPTMMPPEFNGSPFPTGPYGQYPPFHGFSPVAAAGGIMMGPNGQPTAVPATPPPPPHPHQGPPPGFHPQQQQQQHHHHHHQQYVVSSIASDSGDQQQSQQQSPEIYNNTTNIQNMDPHHSHHHQGQGQQHGTSMEMHMEGVTPTSSTSPNSTPQSAFTSFESRPISTPTPTPTPTPTTTANTNNNTTTNNNNNHHNSNPTTSNTNNNNNNNNNNNGDNNSKPFMKIEVPQSANTNSSAMEHDALTSPAAYHSQEYVDGFHLYHNSNNPTHEYHSDTEQHHLQQQQVVHNSNGVNNIDNNNDKTSAAEGGAIAVSSSTHINNHQPTTPTTTNVQLPQQSSSQQPSQINGNDNTTNSNDKLSSDHVPKSPLLSSPSSSPSSPPPVTTDTNTSATTTTKAPSSSTPTNIVTTTTTVAETTTNNNRQRNE